MGLILTIVLLFYIAVIVFVVLAFWKTFTKAGQPGWACLIPIFNVLVMADIAKVNRSQAWKALAVGFVGTVAYAIMFILNQGDSEMIFIALFILSTTSIASMILMFPIYKGIALNFGQSEAFAWGLMLLNVIFFAILGFGNAQYSGENGFKNEEILDADL